MSNSSLRLDARGISHLARNPECERRIAVYQVGETPDGLAGNLRGEIPITMSPFQRQIGLQFENALLENSAAKLLREFHHKGLLPSPENLDSNGIINLEDHYGLVAHAKKPDAQLELLAEKTNLHLRRRMLDPTSEYMLLKAVLKLEFAGFKAYIRPDFLIALHGDSVFYPGEVKSILIMREDTRSADLDKMKRQAAVEYLALQRLYEQFVSEAPDSYGHVNIDQKKLAMLILRDKRMEPRLFQSKLNAELDFLSDAEKILLKHKKQPGQAEKKKIDLDFLKAVPPTLCDTCESECGLAAICREHATYSGQVSALGEDLEKAMPQIDIIDQVLTLFSVEEPPTEAESLLRERLLNELDAAESSGGLKTLDELKGTS